MKGLVAYSIRFPNPACTLEDRKRIEQTLRSVLGIEASYVREYPRAGPPVDHLLVEAAACSSKRTQEHIRLILHALALQAILAHNAAGLGRSREEVEVSVWRDGHPAWAKERQETGGNEA